MLKKFKQLAELSSSELRILFVALFLLPLTALSLKIKGLKWTQSLLNRFLPKKARVTVPQNLQLEEAQSIARIVLVAANHGPYRANCLKKSLVTRWLLSRRGIETDLKIGVNKDEGNFNAHAWVEFQRTVLNDTADIDEHFSVFDSEKLPK